MTDTKTPTRIMLAPDDKARFFNEEEPFRLMVEAVTDYAVFMLSPKGNVLTWNAGAERIKGYTALEIVGKHFSTFYPPEALADGQPARELAVAAADGRYVEKGWRVRKDGSVFWADVLITALRGRDGELVGFGKVTRDLTEQSITEHERRIAEQPFRLMVNAVTDYALIMLDTEGIVTTWNRGAERIKGYRTDEIIGKHFSIFYPPEALQRGLPGHELAIAAVEGRYEDEGWRIRKDGSSFWANVVITALRSKEGALVGFGKVTRDLSERRLAEEDLRASNQENLRVAEELALTNSSLTSILNAATLIGIIATDREGLITTFNRGAELMLGYTAEEIIGKHTRALYQDAENIAHHAAILSRKLGRTIEGFDDYIKNTGLDTYTQEDWVYVHKDGHRISVSLSLSAVKRDDGEVIGYLTVAKDITEPMRVAKELAASSAQLNSILECTSDMIVKLGHDWTLLYGNGKAIEALPDFKLGGNYWDCFPAILATPVEQTLRNAMETRIGTKFENYYAPYERWFKVQLYPSDEGLTMFFTDITDEKKLQEQLALAQEMREQRIEGLSHMAGGLAHEISNPLAIIHGRASDLQHIAQGDEPVSPLLVRLACDSIVKTSDRAIKILRGLKGFGRDAGNDPMEYASIYDLIDQCLDLQQTRFDRHNVDLIVTVVPDIPYLLCREVQIGQILTNLINNAFDAIVQSTAAERWTTLDVQFCGEELCIDVTDSGPGIADKFKTQLMQPFFTTKQFGLGTGIGLSLSRGIAQEHGGSLFLRENTEHTCFRLVLPVDAPPRRSGPGDAR